MYTILYIYVLQKNENVQSSTDCVYQNCKILISTDESILFGYLSKHLPFQFFKGFFNFVDFGDKFKKKI